MFGCLFRTSRPNDQKKRDLFMLETIRTYLFSLYERRLLRNWAYTFAFAIFVPVGLRFALLAWDYGNEYDRIMAIVAGLAAGATAAITLLRIWAVPPKRTVAETPEVPAAAHVIETRIDAAQLLRAARASSLRNRQMARGARALGSPRNLYRNLYR
jgi:hypothetical protein